LLIEHCLHILHELLCTSDSVARASILVAHANDFMAQARDLVTKNHMPQVTKSLACASDSVARASNLVAHASDFMAQARD